MLECPYLMKPIEVLKGSKMYCDACKKVKKTNGYLLNGKSYCLACYQKVFPLYKKEIPEHDCHLSPMDGCEVCEKFYSQEEDAKTA